MTKKYSFESEGLVAKKFSKFVKWVEVVKGPLPKLHFVWEEAHLISIPEGVSDEEVRAKFPGAEIELCNWNGRSDRVFWASDGKRHHRYLCNFRRYGWCWSPSVEGEYGYGSGVVYANCLDGGLSCSTPQQVVRETAIAAFWQNPNGVPSDLIQSRESFDALEWLVDDAIKNIADFAESPIRYRKKHGANAVCTTLVHP